ncbi:MAG: flagellar hook-length control protein FliK [Sulfitobacter sp.]
MAPTEPGQMAAHQQTSQSMPSRADLPPHIARQLADAMPQTQGRPIEITLSPEELGRVRLSITVSDTGVTVNLLAERPETLDLLRRNIDLLGQDFQALGFDTIAFAFSGEDAERRGEPAPQDADLNRADLPTDPDEIPVIELRNAASSGLDLRL